MIYPEEIMRQSTDLFSNSTKSEQNTLMNVGQVKEIAKEWVEERASQLPGFYGAYFAGSINRLPEDALFHMYKDVDIRILLENYNQNKRKHNKFLYKGILLEPVFVDLEGYRSSKELLSSLDAYDLAVESIISDPTGLLTEMQKVVAKEYAQRRWVKKRCEQVKKEILDNLKKLNETSSVDEAEDVFYHIPLDLANLIAIAYLKPRTIRRCFVQIKELLKNQNQLALYESVLAVLGCSNMTLKQVRVLFQESVKAFDRAVAVRHTPYIVEFNIQSCVRPFFVEGTQQIIREGNHREAIWPILLFHLWSNAVIQNDAPEQEKAGFQAGCERLRSKLGLHNLSDYHQRGQLARSVAKDVFRFVDELIENHPDIKE